MEDAPKENQANRVINTLRKPEARSEFTEAILRGFHQYFGEELHQDSPPELIKQFKNRKGIIFPIGSLLRGTARIGSDFDSILVYDSSLADQSEGNPKDRDFEEITLTSEEFHPSHIPFRYWLARRFKDDPKLVKFYDETRSFMQAYRERMNKYRSEKGLALTTFEEADIEKRFIISEAMVFNTEDIVQNIQEISSVPLTELLKESVDPFQRHYLSGYMGILVPQLLTTNLDYVVEGEDESLSHHQRRIVEALAFLEQHNPDVFQNVYTYISDNFHVAVNYQSDNHAHSSLIDDQFKEYVEKSGRFSSEKVEHAAKLLKGVKRQITFPSLQSFKEKYLAGTNK